MAEPLSEPKKDEEAPRPSDAAAAPAPARPVWREYHSKLVAMLFLLAIMGMLILQVPWASETTSQSQNQTTPELADMMFEGYGASFVLLSIVMGAALVGGLFLAKEDPAEDDPKPADDARGGKGEPSKPRVRKVASGKSGDEGIKKGTGGGADGAERGGEAA
jgi:hypothetical protein